MQWSTGNADIDHMKYWITQTSFLISRTFLLTLYCLMHNTDNMKEILGLVLFMLTGLSCRNSFLSALHWCEPCIRDHVSLLSGCSFLIWGWSFLWGSTEWVSWTDMVAKVWPLDVTGWRTIFQFFRVNNLCTHQCWSCLHVHSTH